MRVISTSAMTYYLNIETSRIMTVARFGNPLPSGLALLPNPTNLNGTGGGAATVWKIVKVLLGMSEK